MVLHPCVPPAFCCTDRVLIHHRGGISVLAAVKATDHDLVAMRQAMDEHRRALETDGIAYRADLAFHTAIAEASKNPFGITVLQMISEPLTEQRSRTNGV